MSPTKRYSLPQMAVSRGELRHSDPRVFRIIDHRLYLFASRAARAEWVAAGPHPAPLFTAAEAVTAERAVVLTCKNVVVSQPVFLHEPIQLSPLGTFKRITDKLSCGFVTLCIVVPGPTQAVMYPHLAPGRCVR